MKKRKAIIISSILLLISIFIYCTYWFFQDKTLDIYIMTNDGQTIVKGTVEYSASGIATDESMGKVIGKGNNNGTTFYVYEKRGTNPHNYIIVMFDTEMGVAQEYTNTK